jgi:prevent-host-death family protein
MATTISQRELRNNSGDIMRGLDEGTTYIVTRHGQPVGELTPMRRLRFVSAETVREAFTGAPALDAARFRADLDRAIDQDAAPRA